ncbi:MAG TPA: DUF5685 family protein [Oscillospiraceae bacterium]|nr:DUF5685 family protein [Oscillospiraceae bacterium]
MVYVFGYIRPQKSELLVREYEQYKGIYCNLCKQLGENYGVAARLTLSYDCTFLAMVMLSLSEDCPGFQTGKCVVNPLKKCTYCSGGQQSFQFASALSVIMTYHKVKDDIADSGFFGKIRSIFLLPLVSHAYKKAKKNYSQLAQIVSAAMTMQNQAEHSEQPSIDFCAEPTAQMLSQVFKLVAGDNEMNMRVLEQFGYFLGRWVYLMDAADDMKKDIKSKSFNPFAIKLKLEMSSSSALFEQANSYCNEVLNATLSQAAAAVQLMSFHHFEAIILNIVLLGLPEMQKELLFEKEKKNVGSI